MKSFYLIILSILVGYAFAVASPGNTRSAEAQSLYDFLESNGYKVTTTPFKGFGTPLTKNRFVTAESFSEKDKLCPPVSGVRDPWYRAIYQINTIPEMKPISFEISRCYRFDEVNFINYKEDIVLAVKSVKTSYLSYWGYPPDMKRAMQGHDQFWEVNVRTGVAVSKPMSEWPASLIRPSLPQFKNCKSDDDCETVLSEQYVSYNGIAFRIVTKDKKFTLETSEGTYGEFDHSIPQPSVNPVLLQSFEETDHVMVLKLTDVTGGTSAYYGGYYLIDRAGAKKITKLKLRGAGGPGFEWKFVPLSGTRYAVNINNSGTDYDRSVNYGLLFDASSSDAPKIFNEFWILGESKNGSLVLDEPLRLEWGSETKFYKPKGKVGIHQRDISEQKIECSIHPSKGEQVFYYQEPAVYLHSDRNRNASILKCSDQGFTKVVDIPWFFEDHHLKSARGYKSLLFENDLFSSVYDAKSNQIWSSKSQTKFQLSKPAGDRIIISSDEENWIIEPK